MPVLSMNEGGWGSTNVMLSNGQEMSAALRQHNTGQPQLRSQDDATVGYFFQRPQTDVSQQYNSKRWAVGDDSVIEQVRSVHDLERDFGNLSFDSTRELGSHTKKLWGEDDKGGGDNPGAKASIFPGPNPWTTRDDTWGNGPSGQYNNDHAVSQPISMMHRRPGSFPGSDPTSVLSPRSSETGVLGVNMAEYVLGGSPVGKEFDPRLRMKAFHRVSALAHYKHGGGDGGKNNVVDKGNKPNASPYEQEVKAKQKGKRGCCAKQWHPPKWPQECPRKQQNKLPLQRRNPNRGQMGPRKSWFKRNCLNLGPPPLCLHHQPRNAPGTPPQF
uniref:RNA-binding protein Pumilio n=1 Tax=Platynereis dumerilii TaxID=6359 RepID=L0PRP9_PLADU|nr:RNA-binding protein Pumilio [Platynereis dumerilii]